MSGYKINIIKIGGAFADKTELVEQLGKEISQFDPAFRFVVVHGGGASVTETARRFGIEPVFRDGIRLTSPEEMDIVDMVLSGKVNKHLVRLFRTCGLNAVGLSGSDGDMFTGESIGNIGGEASRTGNIHKVNVGILKLLLDNDYLPVVSSTSSDERGGGLNINADTAAFALSSHIGAHNLVFISDIPGVLKNGTALRSMSTREAMHEIQTGAISGGMIPKVESSIEALKNGVERIIIGTFTERGSLDSLLKGKSGTLIRNR